MVSIYANVDKDNAGTVQAKTHAQRTADHNQHGIQDLRSQQVAQQRRQDIVNNSKRVTQLRQVHPQTSAGVALAPVGAAATFDDQSPTTLNHYTIALAPSANRNAAVQNIQTEYRAFGTSLGNGADSFISRGTLNAWRGASAAQGNLIYQQLTGAGVPIPAPAVASDQNRSMAVHTYSPNGENAGIAWRTPAMMDHLRNWAALPLVDPVKISVTSPIAGGGNVATDIEFTEAHRGYVTHVNALGSNAPMARVAKYGDGTGGTRDGTSDVAPLDQYSMTHHSDSSTTVDEQMNAAEAGDSTLAEKEEGVDAITKVIAEGGRFNCVAALGANLTNESKFYTTDPDDHDRLIYMDFRTLWVQWTSLFHKRYGINNDTVREEIRQLWLSEGQGRVDSMSEDAAGANDYDLRV
ncbi:hypothetical protein H8K33_10105 [Undibacterium amnicola]|uniref:Uncharacterized protein n=1 Tax=Undibacterium amnicola TaxID=1834038 RepID=A0ABR6XQX4_9BURK|nr:hypothetical protein [Undibacterium amnicola]MBC3831861.1 hypothetical protein [Undibacterium amnicola]